MWLRVVDSSSKSARRQRWSIDVDLVGAHRQDAEEAAWAFGDTTHECFAAWTEAQQFAQRLCRPEFQGTRAAATKRLRDSGQGAGILMLAAVWLTGIPDQGVVEQLMCAGSLISGEVTTVSEAWAEMPYMARGRLRWGRLAALTHNPPNRDWDPDKYSLTWSNTWGTRVDPWCSTWWTEHGHDENSALAMWTALVNAEAPDLTPTRQH